MNYTELGLPRRIGISLLAVAVLVALGETAFGLPTDGAALIVALLLAIAGVTAWSVSRYAQINLTDTQLVVGRSSFRPAQFDATFGVHGLDVLTVEERTHVESPTPIPKDATVRIPGGSFGRGAISDGLVLLGVDDVRYVILTRHPGELAETLRRWLEGPSAADH